MPHHILATVQLAENVEAPKAIGVRSGYAPHHKFVGVDYLVSGFHQYDDEKRHYPGENFKAWIAFPSWGFFGDNVKVGDSFEVFEATRLVGHGTVDRVL